MKQDKLNRKMIFFTSDHHFGHSNVIKFCKRPFLDVDDMNSQLIKNWNKTVKDIDIVYVLGDFSMYLKKPELKGLLSQLKGVKILVAGNHDNYTENEYLNLGFSSVCRSMSMRIAGEMVNLSHFPYKKSWLNIKWWTMLNKLFPKRYFKPRVFKEQLKDDGRFLLHGHTHNAQKVIEGTRMIHIGVDAWDYKPVSISKIIEIIGKIKENRK